MISESFVKINKLIIKLQQLSKLSEKSDFVQNCAVGSVREVFLTIFIKYKKLWAIQLSVNIFSWFSKFPSTRKRNEPNKIFSCKMFKQNIYTRCVSNDALTRKKYHSNIRKRLNITNHKKYSYKVKHIKYIANNKYIFHYIFHTCNSIELFCV